LSIVRGLVEAMGGRVWFEPTVGGGATFTVAIPSA
jgi:signal transduction histidine kinase